MARRKSKRSPRRRSTAINISNLAEAYLQTAVWTDAAFGLSPFNFLMSDEKKGTSLSGPDRITLKELVTKFNDTHTGTTMTEGELVWKNVMDNWMGASIKTVGIGIGFRLANRVLRKPKRQLNALARNVGVGDMVRV